MEWDGSDQEVFVDPEESMQEMLEFLTSGIESGKIVGLYAFAVTEEGVQPFSAGEFSRSQAVYGAHALIHHLFEDGD